VLAFAKREEQLMWLVGGSQSHSMAFQIFNEVVQVRKRKEQGE
jgi:hypothetical protein